MTRRGGTTREHAREELRYYGDEAHRWYDWLIRVSGGQQRFRTRILPGVALGLALVVGLTAWAVTPRPGKDGSAGPGHLAATPVAAASSAAVTAAPSPTAEPTAEPTVAPAGPPARPRAQPAGTSGAFPTGVSAANTSQANAFANFRGRANDVVVVFTARDKWSAITGPWIGLEPKFFSNFPGTWVVTVPMYPEPSGSVDTDVYARSHLAACARGEYDKYFRQFGQWLNSKNRGDSFVRIGWEFNGGWFVWKAIDRNNWRECFRNEAKALLSVAPQARIDWSVNAHTPLPDGGDPFAVYPGNDVVDVIGMDTYDQYPPSPTAAKFDEQCKMGSPLPGLCRVINFARQNNKLFSVPEWGLVHQDTPAGRRGVAGGDNPVYIQQMYNLLLRNRDILAYEAYFNDPDLGNVGSSLVNPTQHPNAANLYQQLW
ncbi:hypothetical protein I6A84_40910 [Frankia sp. CNm7]|uniref:GH26 domain-containing protein n=1 Tax=Frankia nepalensis TaxID=1836974 RepID=A0A937R6N9_9ACTN|nr:glycosyl hydrolase [Frankia nepalensis]MBL7498568.1 hypothetical protein [Frankia nepalensis]MBL7513769.1 hypothetical protein [Frankia nepalensis]MBL7524235.1 hypothetical protein [Frankia nepalensis]MBL7626271.1 hypothetical protein [Frankia nepalensis]